MNWRAPKVKVTPMTQSKAEIALKTEPPSEKEITIPAPVTKKKSEEKSEPKNTVVTPEMVVQGTVQDNLFDTSIVSDKTDIDLSGFYPVSTISQDEGTTTYLLENKDGRKIERTYDVQGKIRDESWQDESGGKVERHFFTGGSYTHYTDPAGKRYEISYLDNGQILSKGITNPDDSSKAYYFDRGGHVTGVWYSVPNNDHENW